MLKARLYLNENVSINQKHRINEGISRVNSSYCYYLKNLCSKYKE